MEKEKSKIGDSITFICESCNLEIENQKLLIKHLKSIHKTDTSKPMKREMISHIDGKDWFGGNNRWTTQEGIKFVESYILKRRKRKYIF
jgi:hypothetical protein